MKIITWFILLILIIIEAAAELFLTKAANQKSNNKTVMWVLIGTIFYIAVAIVFYIMLKIQKDLTIVNTIWQGANIIIISIFAYIFFKEKLSKIQILGIIVTIIGIILVDIKPKIPIKS